MLLDTKCPTCGAMMQFDDTRDVVFCPYCGGKVTKAPASSQTSSGEPNLYISYNTNNSAVGMVSRIVSTGTKNTYINGQTLSFHLAPGNQTIILKIGRKNYSREIVIPPDNTSVKIYASFNGRAQITIDQPPVPITHVDTSSQTNQTKNTSNAASDNQFAESMKEVGAGLGEAFNGVKDAFKEGFSGNATNNSSPRPAAKTSSTTKINNNIAAIAILCIVCTLLMVIMFSRLPLASSRQSADDEIVENYQLYLDISSETNLFLNTYDIAISLDGTEIGTVANGKEFTYLVEVSGGKHELAFSKSGSSYVKETKNIIVSNDMTYTCKLSHGSSIKISSESIEENINGSSLELIDVTGIPLSDAKEVLKNAGFSNIREEPYGDIWEEGNWIVTAQSIAPGTAVDKNEFIQLDCVRATDYFDEIFTGKNIEECLKLAEGKWYIVEFKDKKLNELSVSTMSEEYKINWVGTSTAYGRVDKKVCIYCEYTGIPTATPSPTPTSIPSPTAETTSTSIATSGPDNGSRYYTSNDDSTYQDGDKGVYAYSRNAGSYKIYIIIDFDEGYIYYFCDGNGDTTCDRLGIDSGDLNSLCFFYYHFGEDDVALYAVNWAWQRNPDHLILQDEYGNNWDYYPEDLEGTLALRNTKDIIDY